MADQRQEAISKAKGAASNSVSFVLRGSLKQVSKLETTARLAAKESITLRKNITSIVTRVNVLNNIVKDIKKTLKSKSDSNAKVKRIASIVTAEGNAYKLQEAIMEEKPGVGEAGREALVSVSKSIGLIGGIAALIPLLMSPQIRETVTRFFKGFLDGLGINAKKLEELQPYIKMAIGAITAIFAYKALSTVYNSFLSLKKLGQALGLVAIAIDQKAKGGGLDPQVERIREHREKLKNGINATKLEEQKHQKWWDKLSRKEKRNPYNKKWHESKTQYFEKMNKLDREQRKNLGGLSEADELRRKERLEKVAKAKRIKSLKSVKGILGLTAKALKISGIGFAVGVGIDAIGGTIIDMATAEDDVELDGENVIKMAVNNIAQSLTFGLYKGPFEIKGKTSSSEPIKGSQSSSNVSAASGSSSAPVSSAPASTGGATATKSSTESVPSVTTNNGAQIETLSKDVGQKEVDITRQSGNKAIVINNNTNVIADNSSPGPQSAPVNFSTTVGR